MTCVKEDKSTNTNSPFAFSTQDVNTEVCEQLFSWLSKFAPITKHMNRWRFMFLMYYLLDSHNEDIERGSIWSPWYHYDGQWRIVCRLKYDLFKIRNNKVWDVKCNLTLYFFNLQILLMTPNLSYLFQCNSSIKIAVLEKGTPRGSMAKSCG